MNDEAQNMIDSIGCIAELLTVFYNTLKKGGFSEAYAYELSAQLLDSLANGAESIILDDE